MTDIIVEFTAASQSLPALQEAAYRLVGEASCRIDSIGGVHVCHLTPTRPGEDPERLRCRFLDLVTDENLREKLARETEGPRNVILALAFGALAAEQPNL